MENAVNSSKIWITSDFHFGHDKPFIYEERGFETVDDMNEAIFINFNTTVNDNDDVYILGDLCLGGNNSKSLDYVRQLHGRLHIVRGNHDTARRWEEYSKMPNVVEMAAAIYLKYNKYHFYLSHFPALTANFDDEKNPWQRTLSISGHTHGKYIFNDGNSFNACVDAHDLKPIPIDYIIEQFKVKNISKEYNCLKGQERTIQEVKDEIDLRKRCIMETVRRDYYYKYCKKCVWTNECSGPIIGNIYDFHCPLGMKYKRDPPDGGYYG